MKRKILLLSLFAVLVLCIYIVKINFFSNSHEVNVGSYIGDSDQQGYVYKPTVILKEENRFTFYESINSSSFYEGTYSVKGGILILQSDSDEKFSFKIDKGALIFQKNDSETTKLNHGWKFYYKN